MQWKIHGSQLGCLLWIIVVHLSVPDHEDDVPELYEGDIALTKEQAEILRQSQPTFNKSADWNQEAQTRDAIKNPRQLWPGGIVPFKISYAIGTWSVTFLHQTLV